jgi:signal transduction histidine kinase
MRIASKLVLGSTAGMVLILAMHAVLTFRREMRVIDADRRQEGQRLSHAIALAVGLEWDHAGQETALALLSKMASQDVDVYIDWLSSDTQPLPRIGRGIGDGAFSELAINSKSQDVLHSYSFVRDSRHPGAHTRGAIQITQVLADEQARVRDSLRQLGFAVILILLFNAVLATLLSRRWVQRPVGKLLAMAARVGAGEFAVRSSLTKKSGHEFAELGEALNNMALHLQESQAARDLEHQRRLESEMQLQHAERLITIGKLASGVAHEIGTPLNVITGHADMIRRSQVKGEDSVKSAETISSHAGRITSIIKQLLGFSRRQGPKRAEADLAALSTEAASSLLSTYAGKRGVTLDMESARDPHLAFVDEMQMQQVVSNLVMNGIQAMEEGGTLTIAISEKETSPPSGVDLKPGRYICLAVSDTGKGMSSEEKKHIFEPFFTTKDVGVGTGLGLSIAYGIIRDHDGWIEVDSTPGKGSTFSLYVPALDLHDSQHSHR